MTECRLCREREAFAEHHFDGEEIDLDNLPKEKLQRYEEAEEELDETVPVCAICHSEIHGNETKWNPLKVLYKLRKDIIEERKASENRIQAMEEKYELDASDIREMKEKLEDKEKELGKRLKKLARKKSIWRWLKEVRGIGEVNAAGLISVIRDIERFDTVSSLWAYCGLMPENGFEEKEDNGFENYTHYRQGTKDKRTLTAYDIGSSFIRCTDSFYRGFYDEKKEYYHDNRDWSDGHCHAAARRYAVKVFLAHLWQVWRKMENLETTDPYILEQDNGHNRKIEPPYLQEVDFDA